MPSVACLLQAGAPRQQYLKTTIESINKQDLFKTKHITIYGGQLNTELSWLLLNTGWKVTYDDSPRCLAFRNAINRIEEQYTFYIEDDIELANLPSNILLNLLKQTQDGKTCGMLSLNLGGSTFDYPRDFGDFDPPTIFQEYDQDVALLRDYTKASPYFFEFPCVFINTEMAKEIVTIIRSYGIIEEELTKAYSYVQSNYYKLSYCKKEFLDLIAKAKQENMENFAYEMEKVKYYRLLDPRQGGVQWNLDLLK